MGGAFELISIQSCPTLSQWWSRTLNIDNCVNLLSNVSCCVLHKGTCYGKVLMSLLGHI